MKPVSNFMMYKKNYEMSEKMFLKTMFLICFGLLAIGFVVGDSELRPNNTDNMQNDG